MKLFLYKYVVGLCLLVGFILIASSSAVAGNCHVTSDLKCGKKDCYVLMCAAKDCDTVCKKHCEGRK